MDAVSGHHMIVVSAAGGTWGVSGPAFLVLYALGFAVAVGWTFLRRRAVLDPPGTRPDPAQLGAEDFAMIAGGSKLAVTCAVTNLLELGVIQPGRKRGSFALSGQPLHPAAGDYERATVDMLARAGETQRDVIESRLSRGPVATAARHRLAAAGLLATPQQVRACRWAPLPLVVLGAIGVLRAAVGAGRHRPVGFLMVALVLTALAVLVLALRPATTRHGQQVIAESRRRAGGLRSGGLPGQRGLALALFGTAVLWDADPAFAHQLGLNRPTIGDGGSSGSSCGGSSCGGGGGCGGGGCGG